MRGFPAKRLLIALILNGWAAAALAQPATDSSAAGRAASFLPQDANTATDIESFSGLAAAPAAPPLTPASTALAPPSAVAPDLSIQPVLVAPLPNVSPESVGAQNADGLGADMWKGTPRVLAEYLLSIAAPTNSPVLNNLVRRLLTTAAVPPEGDGAATQSLTSMRVEKLVNFGATAEAWKLATHADLKLIDDVTFHFAAENALTGKDDPCVNDGEWIKTRAGADWQKFTIVCQLRAKDNKAAQVALDVLRAQNNRDAVFLEIADKTILPDSKKLPRQLTPLTPAVLALLQLAGLPLPGDIYGHPDWAIVPGLLRAPAQEDVAQLALGERAAERGVIAPADLESVYRTVSFKPDALAAPLTAIESGLRLHALLLRAAEGEKDPQKRIAYAVKFLQSASTAFLNGAGAVAADMLGDVKADPASAANAVAVARIYMLAGRGDAALEWIKVAQTSAANAAELQALWPQFALTGLESEAAFAADIGKWLDAALKSADPQADMRRTRDDIAATLMLLDADGFKIPDAAWAKVLETPHSEKHFAFAPALFEKLQIAGAANRRAETVLLAAALAGDGDISLPVAANITRALRLAGFKSEAAIFARQTVALMTKPN